MDNIPKSIQPIESVIGIRKTLFLISQLTARNSGEGPHITQYIPTIDNLTPDHRLVKILGWEDAFKLCKELGGESYDLTK